MATAYLGLGANLGDRAATLKAALAELESAGEQLLISPVFETDPVGYAEQPSFLNLCVALTTSAPPHDLLGKLKDMEHSAGRTPSFRNAPRPLDIDILLYVDATQTHIVMDTENLTIPHPRLHERAFVLAPLAEIAPRVVHPLLGKTISELRDEVGLRGVRYWGAEHDQEDVFKRLPDEES